MGGGDVAIPRRWPDARTPPAPGSDGPTGSIVGRERRDSARGPGPYRVGDRPAADPPARRVPRGAGRGVPAAPAAGVGELELRRRLHPPRARLRRVGRRGPRAPRPARIRRPPSRPGRARGFDRARPAGRRTDRLEAPALDRGPGDRGGLPGHRRGPGRRDGPGRRGLRRRRGGPALPGRPRRGPRGRRHPAGGADRRVGLALAPPALGPWVPPVARFLAGGPEGPVVHGECADGAFTARPGRGRAGGAGV